MHRYFLKIVIPVFVTAFVIPAAAEDKPAAEKKFETPGAELSYVLGIEVGNSLKRFGTDLDFGIFIEAVRTAFDGEESLVTPDRAREIKREILRERRQQALAEREAEAEKNLAAAHAFLAENKTKEGVITTASGLQYQVIKEGDGPKPKDTDTVTVHYRGTLLDGTEFDSSYARNKPAKFPLKGVIAGWTEALQMMSVGSTYRLFVPPELGYGAKGGGHKIAPNSTLIFDVELLEVAAVQDDKARGTQPASEESEAAAPATESQPAVPTGAEPQQTGAQGAAPEKAQAEPAAAGEAASE